ncbi:MAG: 50S ribosomal protein L11 methyltransferase [bacterium]
MQLSEYISLTFSVTLEYEEILKGYFIMNYEVQGFEETSTGLLIVSLFQNDWQPEDITLLQNFLASLPPDDVALIDSEAIEEKDWNAAWEAEIEPVQISKDLVITPSWKLEEAQKIASTYQLIIDPKMSFGTGHHETTRLCLREIESVDCMNATILDIGTGTGALAMYALLRGAKHAVGIDTDEWSFQNSIENREKNSFADSVFDIRKGDLASTVIEEEQFNIIFANIHRNILLLIASEIATHHNLGGRLILSGILKYDAAEILETYQSHKYSLVHQTQENEWIALHLELGS